MPPSEIDTDPAVTEDAASASESPAGDELWAKLELFFEDYAKKFTDESIDYAKLINKEITSLRRARNALLILILPLCLTVLGIFYYTLFNHSIFDFFPVQGGNTMVVSYISASFVFAFGLLAIMLKAVIAGVKDIEMSSPIWETAKTFAEAGKGLIESER